jgi:uncharacterized iron-regulated protein
MDRASAIAIIREIIELDPERVFEVIADVVRSIAEDSRYSAKDVSSAIDELLQELDRHQQTRQ